MDQAQIDELVRRLVDNPYDEEALAYAHSEGNADPAAYAFLLEKVGQETSDAATASHWLSEAGNVWATTIGDAHRAARVYMMAVDRDPTQPVAFDRLGQLYRDAGDAGALAKLLERRTRLLKPLLQQQPELRSELAGMHEELGRLWIDPALNDSRRALENFRRAIELDPDSAYSMYNAREILKSLGEWGEALALYESELAIERDPTRRVALLRDEAQARRAAGDLPGTTRALGRARELDDADPVLAQEYASSVLDRMQAGEDVPLQEREHGADLLVRLAESYDGEHGLAYASAALDAAPGNSRGLQLYAHYARATGREEELTTRLYAYLEVNPDGPEAADARTTLSASYEAVGQIEEAITVLEPLVATGDQGARLKSEELREMLATGARPSVRAPSPASMRGRAAPSSMAPPRSRSAPPPSLRPSRASRPPGPGASSSASSALSLPPLGGSREQGDPQDEDDESLTGAGPQQIPPHLLKQARGSVPDSEERNDDDSRASLVFSQSERSEGQRRVLSPDKLQGLLDAAQMLSGKGKKPEALAKYKEALESEPNHHEALIWVEDYLRSKRDYAQLRDILLASVTQPSSIGEATETKKERLREVAGLCEGNLRDVDGAVRAWEQVLVLDPRDNSARAALGRLFDKAQRWDDLAEMLEEEAQIEDDLDSRIAIEKKLAQLHESKRKDLASAGEAWARIARLTPEDDRPAGTASKLFERGGRLDRAAEVLTEYAARVEDPVARGGLLERLGELKEQANEFDEAGKAYAEAADAVKSAKLWEAAERCYVEGEDWRSAANAAAQRGTLASDPKTQAVHLFRASELFTKGGVDSEALPLLEQAADLDPFTDEYTAQLETRYTRAQKWEQLAKVLSTRGDRLTDRAKRVQVRRQAAAIFATNLADKDSAREQWLKVLEDGDDREALEKLIDVAVEREDHNEAVTLLRRLGHSAVDRAEKARVALREAELLAEGVGDVDTAIARYEAIIHELDPTCRPALQAIADLQEQRQKPAQAADALERELKLIPDSQERGQIAARLARLYEQLGDVKNAIRALDIVRKADLEDFDALTRLCELCERAEQWDRVAELLAQRVEVEADEEEASVMTRKLAMILADKLDRGDEALAALTELADQGDIVCREAYVQLGDGLGWKGLVASKLVDWWFEAKHGAERLAALRGAFDRFEAVGRDHDAARLALEIVRSKGGDHDLATRLEALAVKTGDHDALSIAHDMLAREVTGEPRASELVRQAEVRVRTGMPRTEAIQHGEVGLAGLPPAEAEPLLERLSLLAAKPNDVIDLYERQVSRSKQPQERMRALARGAQVAAQRGQLDRARNFFELALTGSPAEETLILLEQAARDGDRASGGEKLRRAIAAAMAAGGQGARDGGRTRGALLRRAATLAYRDLNDVDQAFAWWGDALVASVDATTLDGLEALAHEVGDPLRAEAALTHALGEVFDGPLVRQLLARRAKLRREQTGDLAGAGADLKRLLDLSPSEQAVMDELAGLLTELGDYRGMVQLYEDQILRGRDAAIRAELARKVARLWEEQLQDAREAADAWRRVLRMRTADPEATAGLERAKTNTLKRAEGTTGEAYAPPKMGSVPPPSSRRFGPSQMREPRDSRAPRSERPTAVRGPSGSRPGFGSQPSFPSQTGQQAAQPRQPSSPSQSAMKAAAPLSSRSRETQTQTLAHGQSLAGPSATQLPAGDVDIEVDLPPDSYGPPSVTMAESLKIGMSATPPPQGPPSLSMDEAMMTQRTGPGFVPSSRAAVSVRPARPELSFSPSEDHEEATMIGDDLISIDEDPDYVDDVQEQTLTSVDMQLAPLSGRLRGAPVAPAAGLPAAQPAIVFPAARTAPREELGQTGELTNFDFLDATISRPQDHLDETIVPTLASSLRDRGRGAASPVATGTAGAPGGSPSQAPPAIYEEEIALDDDMSEMIDMGDEDDDLPGVGLPPHTIRR